MIVLSETRASNFMPGKAFRVERMSAGMVICPRLLSCGIVLSPKIKKCGSLSRRTEKRETLSCRQTNFLQTGLRLPQRPRLTFLPKRISLCGYYGRKKGIIHPIKKKCCLKKYKFVWRIHYNTKFRVCKWLFAFLF